MSHLLSSLFRILFLAAALVASLPAAAQVIAMQHSSWTAADGAPSGVTGIAQTRDGWLWIASTTGLYRFDGVRFARPPASLAPLSSNIDRLGVLRDGTLWLAYKFGGVSLLRDGRMRHFRAGERNLPGGTVAAVGQDAQGRTWAGASRGLLLLGADDSWRAPDPALAAPAGPVTALLLDRRATFWVRTREGVYAMPAGSARFERRHAVKGHGAIAQHPDGSIWTSDMQGDGLYLVEGARGSDAGAWRFDAGVNAFGFDRHGALWFPHGSGVSRILAGGAEEKMGPAEGLSGSRGFAVFEDREDNVWVGTENGIDRFRGYRLRPLVLPRYMGGARPLAARPGGGVWIDRSYLAGPQARQEAFAAPATEADVTTALHATPDGVLWSGGTGGLWKIEGKRRAPVALPAEVIEAGVSTIYSMSSDAVHGLWVSFGRRGLFTLRDGAWRRDGGVAGLAGLRPTVIASGPGGRVWFGSTDDQLALLEGGQVRRAGRAEGLRMGTVQAILPAGRGAWIGGENGLAWFDGRRALQLTGRGGDSFAGTTGLVFALDGTLWLNGGAGISAISPGELRRALAEPGYPVQFERFDYRDGLLGAASGITPMPSAIRSADGVLWFSTLAASFGFDPAALPRNALAPPVFITALKAGGKEYAPRQGLRLPPLAGALQVDFTALAYRAPERMRFRYRLEGVDGDWREAERHRFAQYTNLAPGNYVFRVIAANDDGVWNEAGAAAGFEVLPSLTQSAWFRAGALLAVLAALWGLHRMRMRRLARRLRVQMQARVDERERIARELHDTLLQSVQGLLMKLGAAVHRLRGDERAPLEQALVDARAVLGEGRERVAGLRGEHVAQSGLAGAIEEYGAALAGEGTAAYAVEVRGSARPLDAPRCEAVFAIAREAVWNAFLHARARNITVTLDYGGEDFTLCVQDDGAGIAPEVLAAGARPGHWGMPGMRERAAGVGELAVDSVEGGGTRWTLRVPLRARRAARPVLADAA